MVESGEIRVSKKGARFIRFKLRIIDTKRTRWNERVIFYNVFIEGPYSFHLRGFLQAIDEKYQDGAFVMEEILGKVLEVKILTEAGFPFPKVKRCMPYIQPGSLADCFDKPVEKKDSETPIIPPPLPSDPK